MNTDDTYLIRRIQAGHPEAMDQLYGRYARQWFRLCLRYGKNKMEAEDMLQEGLINVFESLGQFDPARGAFPNWSNRVMVHAALRYLKRNQWQQSFEDLDRVTGKAEWTNNALADISAKELTQLIQQLPTGYRVVFNMYEVEGYSHREIAEALNITIGTSKSQLAKAKRSLRLSLETYFEPKN